MESPFKKTTVSALQSIENIHGRSPAPKKSALKVSVPADDTGDFNSIVPLEKEVKIILLAARHIYYSVRN